MVTIAITLTPKQHLALKRRIKRLGKGSISLEIRKALDLHLAGERGIERAFLRLLMKKAPKDLPALLAHFNKTMTAIKRTTRETKRHLHTMRERKLIRRFGT